MQRSTAIVLVALLPGFVGAGCMRHGFVIYDDTMATRALAGLDRSTHSTVDVRNESGDPRCTMQAGSESHPQSGFYVLDAQGRARGALVCNGSPGLVMTDKSGEARLLIMVTDAGEPLIEMRDSSGKTVWKMGADAEGLFEEATQSLKSRKRQ